MTDAYQCDSCDEYYTGDAPVTGSFAPDGIDGGDLIVSMDYDRRTSESTSVAFVDLCEDCASDTLAEFGISIGASDEGN